MKIRNGFVSNSSSSSFVVASKSEISKDLIINALNVEKSSPMYKLCEEIADFMYKEKPIEREEIINDLDCFPEEDQDNIVKIIDENQYIYRFSMERDNPETVAESLLGRRNIISKEDFENMGLIMIYDGRE